MKRLYFQIIDNVFAYGTSTKEATKLFVKTSYNEMKLVAKKKRNGEWRVL